MYGKQEATLIPEPKVFQGTIKGETTLEYIRLNNQTSFEQKDIYGKILEKLKTSIKNIV